MMDLFEEYLKRGESAWRTRALTDESMIGCGLTEAQTNVTLATYGDAVLKLALCELLLDKVEELTIEKSKYESDVSLVRVAQHYRLIPYLTVAKGSTLPRDYRVFDIEPTFSYSKKEKLRKSNRRHKYIATALEAVLGAMYLDHRDFSEILTVVRGFMEILDARGDEQTGH
ncbi:MAG: hypothetical protein IKB75_06035 [Clostridia bacterium]|nr:hypothetical protein [Clostridia bacterium]